MAEDERWVEVNPRYEVRPVGPLAGGPISLGPEDGEKEDEAVASGFEEFGPAPDGVGRCEYPCPMPWPACYREKGHTDHHENDYMGWEWKASVSDEPA